MAGTLHIVDPGFFTRVGHHRSLNELLTARALAAGQSARVLANRQVADPGWVQVPVQGVFQALSPYQPVGSGMGAVLDPPRIANDIRAGMETGLGDALAPGDVVLAHSFRYLGTVGALLWAQSCPVADVTLRLGFQSPVSKDSRGHMRLTARHWLYSAFRELAPEPRVRVELVAYSRALAADLAEATGRTVTVVPDPIDYARAGPDPGPPVAEPVVAHLGGLRAEKGGALANRALPSLLARRPALHAVVHSLDYSVTEDARQQLGERFTVLGDALAVPDFYARIQASSAVLVPYDPAAYYLRTTHIGAEALGLARPVVTTPGTWLAEVLRGFDPMPGTIMADYTTESLAAATEALLDDLPAKLAAAARAAPEIRARHDADRVADRLIQPAA